MFPALCVVLVMNISKYTAYRRAQLTNERAQLAEKASNSGGFSAGGLMTFDEHVKVIGTLLSELDNFAEWEDSGEPDFVAPLTEEAKRFWLQALDSGLAVPDEIKAKL